MKKDSLSEAGNDLTQMAKDACAKLITEASKEKRERAIVELVSDSMTKLEKKEGNQTPYLSMDEDYKKYSAGMGFFLHQTLKTLPPDTLKGIQELLVDYTHYWRKSGDELLPTSQWKVSAEDIKAAVTGAIVDYAKKENLISEQVDSAYGSRSESPIHLEGSEDLDSESDTDSTSPTSTKSR